MAHITCLMIAARLAETCHLHRPAPTHVAPVTVPVPVQAAVTRDCLAIFDVLSFSVVGSMDLAVEALAVDPGSGHFAVVVNAAGANSPSEGKFAVVLFRGPSKQPHRAWLLQAAAGWAPPLQLAFVPSVCRQPVGQVRFITAGAATATPAAAITAPAVVALELLGPVA